MLYFPQLNSNFIITQSPYMSGLEYSTVVVDMETGMRWSFSRRGNTSLVGYPIEPLGKFNINYSNITDSEVSSLLTFMRSTKGRYHAFRLLDPGGNLIQYSEDFTPSYWDKTNGVSILGATVDPFGGNLATRLQSTSSNSLLMGIVGPSDGGISGYVVTVSVWLKAETAGQTMSLGFVDSGFSQINAITLSVPTSWKRYSYTTTLWNNNYFRVLLGGFGTWNSTVIDVYGFQVSPMKGEGVYVRTPGNYGYHQYVRFDTDILSRQAIGPNQNAVTIPCVEFNT